MDNLEQQEELDEEGEESDWTYLEDLVIWVSALVVPYGMIRLVWFLNIDNPVIVGGFVVLMFAVMVGSVHLTKKLFQYLEDRGE
jgi:membrane protein YdbS with pleckstrin-like domain